MSDAALQKLLGQLSSLPPLVNPYPVLLEALFAAALPMPPRWFKPVMLANYVLVCIGLACTIAVILLKITHKGAWLYRIRDTSRGGLITPNTTFLLALFALLYFSIAIPAIQFLLEAYVDRTDSSKHQRLQGILWIAVASMTWAEAAGMYIATTLSQLKRHDSGDRKVSMAHRAATLPRLPAWLFNGVFLSFFPIYYSASLVVFGITGEKNAKAWIVYYQLTEAIQPDTLAWVEGEPINMNGSWLPLVNSYVSQMYEVLTLLGNGFLVHAAALLVALLIFIPVAIVYIRMLGQQMNIVTFASKKFTSARKQVDTFRNTYRLMAAETGLVFTFSMFYAGLCLWMGVDTEHIESSAFLVCLIWALVVTSLSGLLLILIGVIMYRTASGILKQRSNLRSQIAQAAQGIAVETQVFVEVDVDDNKTNAAYALAEMRIADFRPQQLQVASHPTLVTFDLDEKRLEGGSDIELKHMEMEAA